MKSLIIVLASIIIVNFLFFNNVSSAAQPPVILYTDITSGPNTGGENNNGTYLSIFGKNFGTIRGNSTVTINGIEVASYKCWNCSDQYGRSDVRKITVQPGGAVNSGTIVVTVNGEASGYADQDFFTPGVQAPTFTVCSGDIYVVSNSSDGSGTVGYINDPFPSVSNAYGQASYGSCDHIVIRGGTYSGGSNWFDLTGKSSGSGTENAVIGYPGEIVLSYLRTAQVITFGTSGNHADYTAIANLKIADASGDGGGGGNGSSCVNAQRGHTGLRFVNLLCHNSVGNPQIGNFNITATNSKQLGVTIKDSQMAGVYMFGTTNNYEIGWGVIDGPTGACSGNSCRGYQMRAGTITNIAIHDGIIKDRPEEGLVIGEGAIGPHNIFNNLHYGNGVKGGCLWVSSAAPSGTEVNFYNNSCYDHVGQAVLIEGTHNVTLRNNIFYQLSGSYISGTATAASNNLCYGVGNCPGGWTNSVNADPLFVDPTSPARNFHIQAGSPAIDVGATLASVSRDFDGLIRPIGNAFDIGAYEYLAAGSPLPDTTPPSAPTGLVAQ